MFNTEDPDIVVFKSIDLDVTTPLHQVILESEWDYLNTHFKAKGQASHPIFNNFAGSYYYRLDEKI